MFFFFFPYVPACIEGMARAQPPALKVCDSLGRLNELSIQSH